VSGQALIKTYPSQMKEILKGIVKASPDGLIEQIKVYFSSDKVLDEP
jgi:hypothetical protein